MPNEKVEVNGKLENIATPEGVADIERFEDLSGDPEFESMLNDLSVAGEEPKHIKVPAKVIKDTEGAEEDPIEGDELDLSTQEGDELQEPEKEDEPQEPEPTEDPAEGEATESEKEGEGDEPEPNPAIAQLAAAHARLREVSAALQRERAARKEETIKKEPDFKIKPIELTLEQHNDIMANPEALSKFAEDLIRKGAALGREAALRDTASMVGPEIRTQIDQARKTVEFYQANPDLKGNTEVNSIAAELIQESMVDGVATITQEEMMVKLGPEVRKRTGMAARKPKATRKKGKAPKLPGGKTRKPAQKKLTGIEAELSEMQYDHEKSRYLSS